MDRVRVALIGYGKVARLHAQVLAGIPAAELVAVSGHRLAGARAFAQQHGIAAFADVAEMIERARVQAVIVCTPHPAHAAPAVQAAEHGAHVLVEKPLAANLSDCDAMITAARRNGVKLGVVSQRRFYPPVQRVRQAIDAGKIGRPILGSVMLHGWRDKVYYQSDPWRGTWAQEGGGVLVNQAPHLLDLLHWFMGPIDTLFGLWGNLNHPYIEVEDSAVAVLRFKNGGLGNLIVSNSQKPGLYGKVHIHGANGATVGVQPEGGSMFIAGMSDIAEPPINDLWTIPGEEDMLAVWQAEDQRLFDTITPTRYFLQLQDTDFIHAIRDDRPPLVTGEDGRATVEIFTAIYRSQRAQVPVQFPVQADAADDRRP